MGYLDFKYQKEYLVYIRRILLRRGLVPDLSEEWQIHGPHQGMDYQVYVGYALPKDAKGKCRSDGCKLTWKRCKRHINYHCVAIYPKAVYEIEEPSYWASAKTEDRMPVL